MIKMPLSEFNELTWRHFFKAVEYFNREKWELMHQTRLIMWSGIFPHSKRKLKYTDIMELDGDKLWLNGGKEVTQEEANKLIDFARKRLKK